MHFHVLHERFSSWRKWSKLFRKIKNNTENNLLRWKVNVYHKRYIYRDQVDAVQGSVPSFLKMYRAFMCLLEGMKLSSEMATRPWKLRRGPIWGDQYLSYRTTNSPSWPHIQRWAIPTPLTPGGEPMYVPSLALIWAINVFPNRSP